DAGLRHLVHRALAVVDGLVLGQDPAAVPVGRGPGTADRRTDRRLGGAAHQLVRHRAPAEHHRHGPPAAAHVHPGVVIARERGALEVADVRAVPAPDLLSDPAAVPGGDEAAVHRDAYGTA